jgi:hypothetical protein
MTWLSKTSIAIRRKIARVTAHLSPYHSSLAPETHDFVAELNAEAQRTGRNISFTVQANRILAVGDIEAAAADPALYGWFLTRAIELGCLEGESGFLRLANSEWRKNLRKFAKTKAGKAEAAEIAKAEGERADFLRKVYIGTKRLHELVKAIPKRELAAMSLNPRDFDPAVSVVHHKQFHSGLNAEPHRFGRDSGRRKRGPK